MNGTIVTPEEFHDALKQNVTDSWDMMVAYAQDPLNRSLSKVWDKKGEFTKIQFSIRNTYDVIVIDQDFVVDLGAPSLQFNITADIPIAVLTLTVNGTITTSISEEKHPGTPKTIPKDIYQLQVTVPIVGITGNQVWDEGHVIKFEEEDDDKACHLIFHFQNSQTTWDMLGHSSSSLNDDTVDKSMQQSLDSIKIHFKNKQNTDWIDYKVAEVTNKKHPTAANGELLCPKSFTMSSQKGFLLVSITTVGTDGNENPRFNTKGTKTIALIFKDYEANEQMGMELVRNVVEVYADQVFKDDAYEEFMGAIVDHLLTVHDKDAALREGKLIALRVKKLTETTTNLQAEQLNTQQELRRERAKAQEEHWTQKDIDKMEAKYKTEVEDNMNKQTDADTERSEQQLEGRKSDEKAEELLEEADKKKREKEKEKEKAEKNFWEDK
ncbi:uncharacterized protein EAE97_008157 [Botrytis byssoidea]|uniref:Uncharacterized protein n=1 Tax=Botrytis byssoidea TaxID=139641 RepID=A0A9P5LZ32_9HELO|nr:uncharacterized protein EAE97_008157 [Botrytis byssoidea]KAF7935250.1 hypothetical protein EAE97_008157 [Botrytis byssoidea]